MTYEHGQWNVLCDRCGFKYKARQLRKEWTGLMVCDGGGTNQCFEHRHPQDFVRGVKDQQSPAWARPEPEGVFIEITMPDYGAVASQVTSGGEVVTNGGEAVTNGAE